MTRKSSLQGSVVPHADEVVAMASGRTLVLWGPDVDAPPMPPAVTEMVRYRGDGSIEGVFDSVISLGQLAVCNDLIALLAELDGLLGAEGVLLFCEPTATEDDEHDLARYDITGTMWAAVWSVIDCRRFRIGRGRAAQEYCWGRARRSRYVGPRRLLPARWQDPRP